MNNPKELDLIAFKDLTPESQRRLARSDLIFFGSIAYVTQTKAEDLQLESTPQHGESQ